MTETPEDRTALPDTVDNQDGSTGKGPEVVETQPDDVEGPAFEEIERPDQDTETPESE